jgi:hypothetical protein
MELKLRNPLKTLKSIALVKIMPLGLNVYINDLLMTKTETRNFM